MSAMGTSCITTVTAFAVVNAQRFGMNTFDLKIWAQKGLSSWKSFQTHLSIRAIFIFLEFRIPKPPQDFGRQTAGQLTKWYFLLGPEPSQ
jgi:hypothetical protein